MKKIYCCFLAISFSCFISLAQPAGQWTWMKGSALASQPAIYGIKGVPDTANNPGSYYESCEWKDTAGNFWIFGGLSTAQETGDLWRFDPLTTTWTWMKGPGAPVKFGVYGIKGVPSPTNQPGCRAWGMLSWVGVDKKLWMFGGYGYGASGTVGVLNDLWCYDMATNEWTWISGSNMTNATFAYGTLGVPSPSNIPPGRCEINTGWQDSTGNFWVFGGYTTTGNYNDLWRFDISTLEWTWMHGANTISSPGSFGSKGVASPTNEPPSRYVYGRWKDLTGNFWLFAGSANAFGSMNDLWKFDPLSNQWTWVNGPNTGGDMGAYGAFCVADVSYRPAARVENRASWVDRCGNFYNFGGFTSGLLGLNDLWQYSPSTDKWKLISGVPNTSSLGNYGTRGVSSATNSPPGRFGSDAFTDANGNFWIFGGRNSGNYLNDVWRYVLDTTCMGISCASACAVKAVFTSSDTAFCDEAGKCIDFFDHSACNPTNWQWIFAGATPSTSALQNPTGICYYYPGTYEVKLIVTNAAGSDTLDVLPHILFGTAPPPPTITVVGGDTLVSTHSAYYQWYRNGVPIAGAVDSFYIATQPGTYSVQGTDKLGCVGLSNGILITGLSSLSIGDGVVLYPNPVNDELIFVFFTPLGSRNGGEVVITDMVGKECNRILLQGQKDSFTISTAGFSNGIYLLKLSIGEQIINKKFVVLHK